MKRLERNCKVCNHPKRNHRAVKYSHVPCEAAKCNNCSVLMTYHEFKLDNLKYLEEVDARKTVLPNPKA